MKIIVKFQYSVIVEYFLFAACRHSYCGSVREEIEDFVAKGMVDNNFVEVTRHLYICFAKK